MMWRILQLILLLYTATGAAAACTNIIGDILCGLNTQDDCLLDKMIRCNCALFCSAKPNCPGEAGDNDTDCECPFNAHNCEMISTYPTSVCPTTCALRNQVTCDPLVTVEGASPSVRYVTPSNSTPRYRDVVTYECDPGWLQSTGPSTQALKRVCVGDGSWLLDPDYQSPALVCQRISCGAVPSAPASSSASRSSGVFQDVVSYTCDVGKTNTGQGHGNHTCNATGDWERTEPDPVCGPVDCGSPPVVTNAQASTNPSGSTAFLTTLSYTCLLGHTKVGGGDGSKMCDPNGQWAPIADDLDIICSPIPCPAVPTITNAVPSRTSGSYRDVVYYTCVTGYFPTSGMNGRRSCTSAGTWFLEVQDPVCTAIVCGATPNLSSKNAEASISSGSYGDSVTYSCMTGYQQSGGGLGTRTCGNLNAWFPDIEDPDPVCTRVTCGAPPSINGASPTLSIGYFGNNVTYTCKPGYDLIGGGTGHLTCSSNGTWQNVSNDEEPVCLGHSTNFINSQDEIQPGNIPGPGYLTTASARSKIHCASFCAASVHCSGFTFSRNNGSCEMNIGSALPVITNMKKIYQ